MGQDVHDPADCPEHPVIYCPPGHVAHGVHDPAVFPPHPALYWPAGHEGKLEHVPLHDWALDVNELVRVGWSVV